MANFRGGMGGFGGMNMQNLMRQAQKMQEDMAKAQEELENTTVEGVSGGGMVKVTMTCSGEIQSFKLAREAVDPDDIEMLEDLILAAIKDAGAKAKDIKDDKMGGFGNLGGLM
jgi:DNA-binding YbaB/EbfC family protein